MHDRTSFPLPPSRSIPPETGAPVIVGTMRPAPWATTTLDPAVALAQLSRSFPDVSMWMGKFTGHYWALIRDRFGRDRLIEAANATELGFRIVTILPRPSTQVSHQRPAAYTTERSHAPAGRHASKRGFLSRTVRTLIHPYPTPRSQPGDHRR